jgi:uncharacterized membrane protein YidH (DUF202 family)
MTDSELMDVGTQAERTALAWQRTGIGVMAAGALLTRWDATDHLPVWPGALLTLAASIAVLVLVPIRYRRVLRTVRAGQTPVSRMLVPATMALIAAMTIGVGVEVALRVTG